MFKIIFCLSVVINFSLTAHSQVSAAAWEDQQENYKYTCLVRKNQMKETADYRVNVSQREGNRYSLLIRNLKNKLIMGTIEGNQSLTQDSGSHFRLTAENLDFEINFGEKIVGSNSFAGLINALLIKKQSGKFLVFPIKGTLECDAN